jgi:hypothetical protein
MFGPLRTGAGRLAEVDAFPTPVRAVFGHYAEGGLLESSAIRLQRHVEQAVQELIDEAYEDVERAIAAEFDRESVDFTYDTKLTLPVELTLGHVYRRATAAAPPGVDPVAGERKTDPISKYRRSASEVDTEAVAETLVRDVRRAEDVAQLVVVALLDGDMRDAINDAEFDDFNVDFEIDEADRERVAEIAQEALQAEVVDLFAQYPDHVREAYTTAVERSEAHQSRDPHFRDLMADAVADEPGGKEALREEYRDAEFEERPTIFAAAETDLPYLVTQYGRVGVIYHGMIEMFRRADVSLSREFERSVVLAIIGAQVWLDDVDDFAADMTEGQLTPVTAEYLLAHSDAEAHDRVVEVTNRYLDKAREAAHTSDAPITGLAVEYIRHAGDSSKLPR